MLANFGDIIRPDVPPRPGYCEEVVIGVASSMQVLATLAPNPSGPSIPGGYD